VENAQTIQRGVGVALGDGRSTKFWLHNWPTPSALLDLVKRHVPANEQTRMVHDYWEEGQGWRWHLLEDYLADEALKAIASFELGQEGIADGYFWRASYSGRFTLKSALALIRQDAPVGDTSFWKEVWRINAPQRVKVFGWLALHEKVRTNLYRFRRGLTNNPYCYIYDQAYESVQHMLRDCPEANIT